jgi:hypothetical protein
MTIVKSASIKPKFIDFQALKQEIRIEQAMPLLGLTPSQFSDQMRSPCPACKSGGDRALVITASKSVFYCFASGQGGDVISLTSHIKGISMKEAAAFLAEHFHKDQSPKPTSSVATVPSNSSPKKNGAGQPTGLNPLTYLQPEHPLVQALGISPDTCRHFGAGYAPKGIMRGRLAIPVHGADGVLLAYCGLAVEGNEPNPSFPKYFDPTIQIFNLHRCKGGRVNLRRSPLDVMKAYEHGIDNTICFLTDTVSKAQLLSFAETMQNRNIDSFLIT